MVKQMKSLEILVSKTQIDTNSLTRRPGVVVVVIGVGKTRIVYHKIQPGNLRLSSLLKYSLAISGSGHREGEKSLS